MTGPGEEPGLGGPGPAGAAGPQQGDPPGPERPRAQGGPLRRLVGVRVSATQLAIVLASSVAAAALVVGGTLAQGSPPDAVVAALARGEVVVHRVPGAAADANASDSGDGADSAGASDSGSGSAGAGSDANADGAGATGDGSDASGTASGSAASDDGSAAASDGDGSGASDSGDGSGSAGSGASDSSGTTDGSDGPGTGDTGDGSGSGAAGGGSGATGAPKPSKIKHVAVISLTSSGYDASFGAGSAATYLDQTLVRQGTLLTGYRLLDAADLPNALALVSGQPPNPLTRRECPTFTSYAPAARPAPDGSFAKAGCVYPVDTLTLADQVSSAGGSWRAYVEGTDAGTTCQHPAFGAADPTAADQSAADRSTVNPAAADPTATDPTATDPTTTDPTGTDPTGTDPGAGAPNPTPPPAYATRHNPFVYFHSLLDLGDCATNDVGLDKLATDLARAKTTPELAYVVPDQCDRGVPGVCPAGTPDGPAAADAFLRTWAPRILAAPGFRRNGLLVVTFDGDAQTTRAADKPKVGTLLISPWTPKDKLSAQPANPYALLRTIEDLLGLAPLARAGAPTTHPLDHAVIPHL